MRAAQAARDGHAREIEMDKALNKLAKQLLAFDEASLTSMWERYAAAVEKFEPTQRWEEAAVMLGMIQAVRWKNQLFNHHWKQMREPGDGPGVPLHSVPPHPPAPDLAPGSGPGGDGEVRDKRGKVLRFRPREDDDAV